MANNYDAIAASIMKQLQGIVNEAIVEVAPEAVNVLQKNANEKFYKSYSPQKYSRSFSLLEDSSYKISKINNGISISSNKFYEKKNMFDIAEHGASLGLWNRYPSDVHGYYSQYNRDSHFLSSAFAELNNGLVVGLIKAKLRAKGLNVR